MINYLLFWWQSSNEHGVHSPYVFRYLTRGLYGLSKKYRNIKPKPHRLVISTIDYFSLTAVYCTNPALAGKIEMTFPQAKVNSVGFYDIMICDNMDEIDFSVSHKDTLFLVLNPRREEVKTCMNSDRFRLVIDFYHGLFLQNRTEQRRQNFTLRY